MSQTENVESNQNTNEKIVCVVKKVNPLLDSFLSEFLKRGSPVEEWYEAHM